MNRPVKAGAAYVEIGIRSRLQKGARQVQNDLKALGRKVTNVGAMMAGLGATAAAPLALATRLLVGFDDAMRAVGGVTQASAKEMSMLRDTAKELGRTTSFTAAEVAGLMIELGRAGFSPDQIDAMTGAVLNLSRATGTEASLAAGIMAASIRQFGLEAGDAARVSDSLTAAANGSFNSVEALGEALKYAGPVAADLGMSIEETLAVLGTLGNVGIQGSMAGTTLKRLSIIGAAEVQRLEQVFGVSLRNAAGAGLPLVAMLGRIADATNGLDRDQRVAKLNEAFGLLGITGASAIGGAAANTQDLLRKIQSAAGVAARTSEEMDAGIGGAFRKIMSAAEGAGIAIAETFEVELQVLTETLTEAIGAGTQWVEQNKELVASAVLATAGIVGIGTALVATGVSMQIASYGVGVLMTTMGALRGVMVATTVVASGLKAAVLVASATYALWQGTLAGTTAALGLMSMAQAANGTVAAITAGVMGFLTTAINLVTAAAAGNITIAGMMSAAWTAAAGVIGSAWAVIAGPLTPIIAAGLALLAVVAAAGAAVGGIILYSAASMIDFAAAWQQVKDVFRSTLSLFKEVGGTIMAALQGGQYELAARALWAGLKVAFFEGANFLLEALQGFFVNGWAYVQRFFGQLAIVSLKVFKAIAKGLLNPIGAVSDISSAIATLAADGMSMDLSLNADAARTELRDIKKQLDDERKKREMEEKRKQQQKQQQQAGGQQRGPAAGPQTPGASLPGSGQESDTAKEMIKSLEEEIYALEHGEEAARRKKLADEGATKAQIAQIEALKQKKKAVEDAAAAERKAHEARLQYYQDAGDRLAAQGASAQQIFALQLQTINQDAAAGRITKDEAQQARDDARAGFDDRRQKLRDQASNLINGLMTPEERAAMERRKQLGQVAQFRNEGLIDDKKAAELRKRIEQQFRDSQTEGRETIDQANARVDGVTGTFSGFSAGFIAQGAMSFERKKLLAAQETAKNTAQMRKELKQQRTRFNR